MKLAILFIFIVSLTLPTLAVDLPTQSPFPLPPLQAAQTMNLPEGFTATLFAGEPAVNQPIGFTIDDRGRLWVAEAYSYPVHSNTAKSDRILIFEDTNHDGAYDKRTVFYDKLNYITGIELGFGGAFVMSPPNFYFIPDTNNDDIPDGPPQILLTGFGNHANSHNLANGFTWGPDGWLYATHGRTNWSMIGKPGTPEKNRTRFDGGIWRYHPIQKIWEPYTDGTTNPWGIDFDDLGQGFIPNTVDPHLFHAIQGAHFEPWRNRQSSQFAYKRIETIADHLHYLTPSNSKAGIGSIAESKIGGGHSHCGIMVYLGDNFPDQYRNTVFTHNTHGRRINNDAPQRKGSGYTATHNPDFLQAKDPWFMGVSLRYGPDGAAYATDWSDTGECHTTRDTHKNTGRIYKIAYGKPSPVTVNIAKNSNAQLVQYQLHKNDWFVQHARRVLQERFANGDNMQPTHQQLHAMFANNPDITRKLRALWALHATQGLTENFLIKQLDHNSEYIRAWAVRFLAENRDPSTTTLKNFQLLAQSDPSPFVRLHLASSLQRFPNKLRWDIAAELSTFAEDADDQNIPLMIWYAIEPLVHDQEGKFASLVAHAQIPLLHNHIARRIASLPKSKEGLNIFAAYLPKFSHTRQASILAGLLAGFKGRENITAPSSLLDTLNTLADNPTTAQSALELILLFDAPAATQKLKAIVTNTSLPSDHRTRALQSLINAKPKNITPWLIDQLTDPLLQRPIIRGLVRFNHPQIPNTLLNLYPSLPNTPTKQDTLQTLAARPTWATALLNAIDENQIPATDLTAYTARQIDNLNDKSLSKRITQLFGSTRPTPRDKQNLITTYTAELTNSLPSANLNNGAALFTKSCAPCHTLFDSPPAWGPNLTGSNRSSLHYLLENIVDPSASVPREFQTQIFQLKDGSALTAFISAQTETTLTLRSLNDEFTLPKSQIKSQQTLPTSIMPDGLLQSLTPEDRRDLIAYLMSN